MDTRVWLQPLGRPGRVVAGFDLVQLAVVLLLIALLSAVAWATFIGPAAQVRDTTVELTLTSVDVEARSLARQSGAEVDPGLFVGEVIGTEVVDGIDGCPRGGLFPSPVSECELDDDDPNRFRLWADTAVSPATVTMVRFGSCGELTVDPEGLEAGVVEQCDASDPAVNP